MAMQSHSIDAERLTRLSSGVDEMFAGVLNGWPEAALLDFPDHPNVGDSAIYCGEASAIKRVWNGSIRYIASFSSYDRATLDAATRDGLLMIHGGGNIGEIYPHHHGFRLRLLREWAGRRLVQLPQTIHFGTQDADDEFARAIERHGNFHLIVRDLRSYEHAKKRYQCEVTLAPDSAFALDTLSPIGFPTFPVLALCRTDAERKQELVVEQSFGTRVCVADWPEEHHRESRRPDRLVGRVGTFASRKGLRRAIALANWSFDRRAWLRLQRGIALLSMGEVVATDRLHAYVLALKLGKRYFVSDNSYGKLSAVYQTWLEGTELGTWTESLPAAINSALLFNSSMPAGRKG